MDRRLTPFNGRVAAAHLRGLVSAELFVDGSERQITAPVVDLLKAPNGSRDRQLVFGERIRVFDDVEGLRFIQSEKDGYVGYVPTDCVGPREAATHWVTSTSSHAYSEPDIKSAEAYPLYFGSQLSVRSHTKGFFELSTGTFVPRPHVWPIDKKFTEPATVAQMFFGSPYLWGANTAAGLDCSGLVQAAWTACGMECDGDSDLQERSLGEAVPIDAPLLRGDLVFWTGHVAIAVDEATLIHANAHAMSVAYEPFEKAVKRIEAQGDGRVTSRRRVIRRPE